MDNDFYAGLIFLILWATAFVIGCWITIDILRLLSLGIDALHEYLGA